MSAFTLENIPLIKPGSDIAKLIVERTELKKHDIVIISSTIVSKSENRIRSLKDVNVTEKARTLTARNGNDPRFVQAVLDESVEILLEVPFLLVRTRTGSICVNAGIDHSNVEGADNIISLPESPDGSAKKIKDDLFKLTGKKVSVIITDTNGRAFRIGQSGIAIGIAGIRATKDWRGTKDLFGRVLEVKNEAIVDEIAGFANILLGEGNGGTPIAIISGLDYYCECYGIGDMNRPEEEDVIRAALIRSRSA
ncbi:MAG: coenzyme F420-0:L-glutamate ligase [Candidatus Methanoperedens sp.]|nr:coenzyme F420-0:L-glutamate ligase [Candidatus Methanoperedens sp.]MCE8429190.1 coenzyme F420-0:L-glutamate ligase [Candidatus Methanoperedens sp.]